MHLVQPSTPMAARAAGGLRGAGRAWAAGAGAGGLAAWRAAGGLRGDGGAGTRGAGHARTRGAERCGPGTLEAWLGRAWVSAAAAAARSLSGRARAPLRYL